MPVRAQSSGRIHEHVAPIASGASIHATGPWFKVPNMVWDDGENPANIDHGGCFDYDDTPLVLGTHVHRYHAPGSSTPEPWTTQLATLPAYGPTPEQSALVHRLRGYFAPAPLPSTTPVLEAAFELIATEWRPGKPVVVCVSAPATTEFQPELGTPPDLGKFAYGGFGNHSGLAKLGNSSPPPPDKFYTKVGFAVRAQLSSLVGGGQYNLVCAQIEQRALGRNLTFHVQRCVQLSRGVRLMLRSSQWLPPGWEIVPAQTVIPVLVEGGSYGGYVAMTSVVLFPDDFHGAFAGGTPISVRSYISEQQSWTHLAALTGHGGRSGREFSLQDTLDYGRLLSQYRDWRLPGAPAWNHWSGFLHTSTVYAWSTGMLRRPVYFVFGDEDAVTTGTLSMAQVDGIVGYHDHGFRTVAGRPWFGWAIADRRCHPGGFHRTASGLPTHVLEQDMLEFLPQVIAAAAIPETCPPPNPDPGAIDGTTNQDPCEHALRIGPYTQPAPSSGALILDAGFSVGAFDNNGSPVVQPAARRAGKSFGCGTWLGGGDSLLIHGGSAYVGSAEGVVTRFLIDPMTHELEPQSMSQALGYGAWAMAMGDVDGSPGDELVVATHRGVFVLDVGGPGGTMPISDSMVLDWAHSRPHHMKLAQFEPGQPKRIVFATELGDLVGLRVNGGSFSEAFRYPEPGIVDFEFAGIVDNRACFVLLSERGHLVTLGRDVTTGEFSLLATSARLNGHGADLELWGADKVLVLSTKVGQNESLHAFALPHLAPVALGGLATDVWRLPEQLGLVGPGTGSHFDLEVVAGGGHLLILLRDWLFGFTLSARGATGLSFVKNLSTFPPMGWPLDIAVGDLGSTFHDENPWNVPHEVLVSTRTGYLCWQPLDHFFQAALSAGPQNLTHSPYAMRAPHNAWRQPSVLNGAPGFCNRTTAATWAMAVHPTTGQLHLVDQAGSMWRIDPVTGNLTFLYELRHEVAATQVSAPLASPIRSMAWVGPLTGRAVMNPQWLDLEDQIGFVPGATTAVKLTTRPFRPQLGGEHYFTNYGYGPWCNNIPEFVYAYDGFLVMPRGGAASDEADASAPPGCARQVHWWSGGENLASEAWVNQVQGMYLDSAGFVQDWWATTRHVGTPSANMMNRPASEIAGNDLRDGFQLALAQADAQSLQVFQDPYDGNVRVAVATTGGSVIVLDPTGANQISPIAEESPDFGSGGMALAVKSSTNQGGYSDIYLGVLAHHTNPGAGPGTDAVGAVIWLEWTGSNLSVHKLHLLDGSAPDRPKAYGVCGLAVGDVIFGNGGDEVVVTTLDGQFLVFERSLNGWFGALLYHARFEGSLGAYNSIVIADLDPGALGNEVYVAGSLGVRKFRNPGNP